MVTALHVVYVSLRPRASEVAQSGNRKTLTSADVLAALKELELESFSSPLKEAIDGDRHTRTYITFKSYVMPSAFNKEQAAKKQEAKARKAQRTTDGAPAEADEADTTAMDDTYDHCAPCPIPASDTSMRRLDDAGDAADE